MSGSDPHGPADAGGPGAGGTGAEPEKPEMWSRERVVTGWAQLWNLPNMLTLLRILMIPFFWYLLMYDGGANAATRVAATVVFVLASITDWLDGWLARKQGLVTTFGKIADPLADKALTGVALIGLSVLDELWWWITILIISREVGVTLIRFGVLKHGVIPASRGGKAKTLFQMVGITLFLLPITPEMTLLWWTRNVVMGIAVLLTALTGLDYISKAYWTRSDSKTLKAEQAASRAAAAAPVTPSDGSTGETSQGQGSDIPPEDGPEPSPRSTA